MSEFCYSLENKTVRNQLFNAIKGSGAFRRFKTSIQRFEIEEQWYSFKDKYLYDMAVEWCERNGIAPIIDDKAK